MADSTVLRGLDKSSRRHLIIHGDDDSIVPYPNADVLHGAIAGSKKHTLKAAGHMFFWEVPEETVRVAGDFLAAVK